MGGEGEAALEGNAPGTEPLAGDNGRAEGPGVFIGVLRAWIPDSEVGEGADVAIRLGAVFC